MQITLTAAFIGIALGFFIALMKISKFAPLRAIATTYIAVIRGTPMFVQLLIWWFVIFPMFAPQVDRMWVAIIAFGVNSGAYVAEIFRAGILSVDKGQTEAGRSVGLSSTQTMRLIILPQAIKNSLPALCNEFISLFKETSIAGAVIGVRELTLASNVIRSRTFDAFMPLIAVALIYLVVVLILTWLMTRLERRLRKSDSR
ncbi:MAG: amino acid ABC transporter permease [Oscillospiraceae bacterium]|nr:amino acid ABC transporter permease [Oscillospiraceae bacterium]